MEYAIVKDMETLLNFLLNNWKYGVWIIIGGFLVWMYFSIRIKSDNAKDIAGDAHKRLNKLPCDTYKENIDKQKDDYRKLDYEIKKVNNGIEYINKNISFISKGLMVISDKMQIGIMPEAPLTQPSSPLILSDKGKEKAAELGIERMINDRWSEISSLIEGQSGSRNPYDIQQICINEAVSFPEKFISKEDIENIKLDAYKNGDLLQSYMRVIAIIVRDRFFKEHGIDVSEVDKYDPIKS